MPQDNYAVEYNQSIGSDKSPTDGFHIKNMLSQLVGLNTSFETLYWYNFFTAAVHALSCILIFSLSLNITPEVAHVDHCGDKNYTEVFGPYLPSTCVAWTNTSMQFETVPEQQLDAKVYLATLVTSFFFLSAACQAGQGCFKEYYRDRVETNGVNLVRYIEYSFSASIMMLALACAVMVFDMYTHILIFTCTMLCMLLGIAADELRTIEMDLGAEKPPGSQDGNYWDILMRRMYLIKWFTHYLGWMAMLVPYIFVFMVQYFRAATLTAECLQNLPDSEDDRGPPAWVTAMIVIQFMLFAVFGVVQTVQFWYYPTNSEGERVYRPTAEHKEGDIDPFIDGNKRVGIRVELAYITLSAVSKTILGWTTAANLLFI